MVLSPLSQKAKKHQDKNRALGLCITCSKMAWSGSPYCKIHRAKALDRARRHRDKRKQLGLCTTCGKSADKNSSSCLLCYRKQLIRTSRCRAQRVADGMCRYGDERIYKNQHCLKHWSAFREHQLFRSFKTLKGERLSDESVVRIKEIYETEICYWCEGYTEVGNRSVDHVIPRIKGGGNEPGNLVMACIGCNSAKRDLLPSEWESLLSRRIAS